MPGGAGGASGRREELRCVGPMGTSEGRGRAPVQEMWQSRLGRGGGHAGSEGPGHQRGQYCWAYSSEHPGLQTVVW